MSETKDKAKIKAAVKRRKRVTYTPVVPDLQLGFVHHNVDCIGCGACVAACPNASAMLFTGAKVAHLALLPQGQVERSRRVKAMVEQMDEEGFGACSNTYACSAECPKEIPIKVISKMNREYFRAVGP